MQIAKFIVDKFINPADDEIRALLGRVRTITVVGLSPKAHRPSHQVASQMQGFGYRIIPVRPAVDAVLGERAYARLEDVPDEIDLVDVFRAPRYVDGIVDFVLPCACRRCGYRTGSSMNPPPCAPGRPVFRSS